MKILRSAGIEVPKNRSRDLQIIEKLKTEEDDKTIQELLDALSAHGVAYYSSSKKADSPILNMLALTKGLFSYKSSYTHIFEQILRENGIPTRIGRIKLKDPKRKTLSYYVIAAKRKEKALRILGSDKRVERFKINPALAFFTS